ncbi:MAG: glycosyltransferase [Ferruginibacter sp.]
MEMVSGKAVLDMQPGRIDGKALVAIWMVTYNHGKFIRDAIESVMVQKTSFDCKLYIGEDFSSDETRTICIELKNKYPGKIELFLNERNLGSEQNARNIYKQCFASSAKYIAMLEGDDYWSDSYKLQKQIDFLENNESFNACFHNVSIIDADNPEGQHQELVYQAGRKSEIGLDDLGDGDYMKTCSLVYRNQPAAFTPFMNDELPIRDTSLGYCLLFDGKKAKYVDETMAIYRKHFGGIISKVSYEEKLIFKLNSLKIYRNFYHDSILKPRLNKQFEDHTKQLLRISARGLKFFQATKCLNNLVLNKIAPSTNRDTKGSILHKNEIPKKILFTFDYELFLGVDSGNVSNCLIKSTNKILDMLNKYSLNGIFFVDTLYLCHLKDLCENNQVAKKDFDLIALQLNRMVNEGHDVFMHIHPHWIDAVYNEKLNTWSLRDYSKYLFSSLDNDTQANLFKISYDILKEIITAEDFLPDGYRAGGWSIQPFPSFKPYFEKYGIKHEFSVIPGKSVESTGLRFDFIDCPEKNIYKFENDVCEEKGNGKFTEYAISVLEIPHWLDYIDNKVSVLFFVLKLKFAWPIGNGKTIQISNIVSVDKHDSGRRRIVASFENFNFLLTFFHLRTISKKDYWHFISHPKILSPMNLFFMNYFLKRLNKKFNVETNFRKF